jgi:hypothetical protein
MFDAGDPARLRVLLFQRRLFDMTALGPGREKLHQLAWPSGRFTPDLEVGPDRCGDARRVAEVLAYRLVEGQKGSESRGSVGLHWPAGVWGRACVLGWPDSFRYELISFGRIGRCFWAERPTRRFGGIAIRRNRFKGSQVVLDERIGLLASVDVVAQENRQTLADLNEAAGAAAGRPFVDASG